MPRFGAHLSVAGGPSMAVERAVALGCDCLQIFVKSPRRWRFTRLGPSEVARFREAAEEAGLDPVVGHASYLLNLASPDRPLRTRSRNCLGREWDRAEKLRLSGLVLHPGSHVGSGAEAGIARVAETLDRLHEARPDHTCRILLESTAGGGGALGGTFEELAAVLAACGCGARLGVALDTCHLLAAGYDLRTPESVDATVRAFDTAGGLARVALVHANDAAGPLGSRRDRHAHIGRGRISRDGFRAILAHPSLAPLPFILETPKKGPKGQDMDPTNLRALRRLARY